MPVSLAINNCSLEILGLTKNKFGNIVLNSDFILVEKIFVSGTISLRKNEKNI